jgi:hypothetical protein
MIEEVERTKSTLYRFLRENPMNHLQYLTIDLIHLSVTIINQTVPKNTTR